MKSQLLVLAEGCAARHSVQVVDLILRGSERRTVVEIFIDSEAGINTDLCATMSRDVSDAIDGGNVIKGQYDLVVSSPGIDRPLSFAWQYKKHIGRRLHVKAGLEGGVQEFDGKLIGLSEAGVTLEVGREGEITPIPFDRIEEAIVKAPW